MIRVVEGSRPSYGGDELTARVIRWLARKIRREFGRKSLCFAYERTADGANRVVLVE